MKTQSRLQRVMILVTLSFLLSLNLSTPLSSSAARGPDSATSLSQGPVEFPPAPSYPLQQSQDMPTQPTIATTPVPNATYNARILVISADGAEADLPAIRQSLDYVGAPYDVYTATLTPNGLTASRLYTSTNGFYQGVILTTSSLGISDGGAYRSALSPQEWQTLWNYEAIFGVRQVSWYTYPTPDYGFTGTPTPIDTTPPRSPLNGTLTTAGRIIFPYLNPLGQISIKYSYTYRASAAVSNTTTLISSSNRPLALIKTYPDGRENLAMTFDSSPYLVHALQVGYGVINWVTRGVFIGERHVYIGAQIDDVLIDDNVWPPTTACGTDPETTGVTYRIDGADLQNVRSWQVAKRGQAMTGDLRFDMAFNGEGSTDIYSDTTLLTATTQYQSDFGWINHTYDHDVWTGMSYSNARTELSQNDAVARLLGFTNYNRINLITPEISGLDNRNTMRAAYASGTKYVVGDTSRPTLDNPSPNIGINNALQPSILIIPRHPNNLFYNVSTPDEWRAEYNCLYRSYWGRNLSYNEILGKESDVLLQYLLNGDMDPWMFHQPNLRKYNSSARFLLGELLDMTLDKYDNLFNLPIVSPTMDKLGERMANRMASNAAGITATIHPGQSIVIHAARATTLAVTGVTVPNSGGSTSETYGGQPISYIKFTSNNQTKTIALP